MSESPTREISVRVQLIADDRIAIDVADTGHGIDPGIRDSLFLRAITTKELGEGSGIGLQLSKTIIDEHRGTLEVREPGRGESAVFRICLPRAESSTDAGAEPTRWIAGADNGSTPSDKQTTTARSVLLVDDEEGIRQLLTLQLSKIDIQVTDMDCVEAALAWLAVPEHAVDVVICDLNMPGKSGSELLRAVIDQGLRVKRFIMLTGSADAEIEESLGAAAAQVHVVLKKPFRFKDLAPYLEFDTPADQTSDTAA